MSQLLQDIRYTVRTLFHSPTLTLVVVLTLALGIGPNAVIFTVLDAVLINEGPYLEADKLLILNESDEASRAIQAVSYPNFEDWRTKSGCFQAMAAYRPDTPHLKHGDSVDRVTGQSVSLDFFSTLGVAPMLGRTFSEEDFRLGSSRAVVLSHAYWAKEFGSRPEAIGSRIILDGEPGQIIGVMPRNFRSFFSGRGARVWVALNGRPEQNNRATPYVEVVARPKAGVSIEQARAEMAVLAGRLSAQYPASNAGRGVTIRTIRQIWMGTVGIGPRIIATSVLFVLLIACANVANILLARGVSRRKEMAIRRALGGGRFRIVRQLLTESVILGLLGGIGGVVLGYWGVQLINISSADLFSDLGIERFEMDLRTLRFTAVIALVAGVVFGTIPAIRTSKVSLSDAIKEGGSVTGAGRAKSRMAGVLVASELALSLVLLIGASLVIRSYVNSLQVSHEPGFRTPGVLTAEFGLSERHYEETDDRTAYFREAVNRLRQLPGVEQVGLASTLPGGYSPGRAKMTVGTTDPSLPPDKIPGPWVNYRVVSPGYFEALGIPLLRGRLFTDLDNRKGTRVAVINQKAASEHWSGGDPIGATISINGVPFSVVGVVGNVQTLLGSTDRKPMEVCVPFAEDCPLVLGAVISSRRTPDSLVPDVKKVLASIGTGEETASGFRTMEEYLYEALIGARFMIGLLGAFALLALLIAAAGVYGVMSHFVSQKLPEIGIRMALGAGKREILRHIMIQGACLVSIGIAVGFLMGMGLTRILPSALFGVLNVTPVTFGSVTLLLAIVALLACYIPAQRATRVDPMTTLRCE